MIYRMSVKIIARFDTTGNLHCVGDFALKIFIDGKVSSVWYKRHGNFHNLNGPAYILYKNEKPSQIYYFINDNLHRIDGPAITHYHDNGVLKRNEYWIHGLKHRIDLPQTEIFYTTGILRQQFYYEYGVHPNRGNPSEIKYYENGNFERIDYSDKMPNMPRSIIYYKTGRILNCTSYIDQNKFNESVYHPNGKLAIKCYHEHGRKNIYDYYNLSGVLFKKQKYHNKFVR